MAPMPTASTAQILGNNESFERLGTRDWVQGFGFAVEGFRV